MKPARTTKRKYRKKKNRPEAMKVVTVRLPHRLLKAVDESLEDDDWHDRSSLVRLALATYIGHPELAEQPKKV